MTEHAKQAGELFAAGYNCAQSVLCAFCDVTGQSLTDAIHTAAGLGGGIARQREACGAVSAMAVVLGFVFGSNDPADHQAKAALYARIQAVSARYRQTAGSIVCREILGKLNDGLPEPEIRTEEYYHRRPCRRMVELAAEILDAYLSDPDSFS